MSYDILKEIASYLHMGFHGGISTFRQVCSTFKAISDEGNMVQPKFVNISVQRNQVAVENQHVLSFCVVGFAHQFVSKCIITSPKIVLGTEKFEVTCTLIMKNKSIRSVIVFHSSVHKKQYLSLLYLSTANVSRRIGIQHKIPPDRMTAGTTLKITHLLPQDKFSQQSLRRFRSPQDCSTFWLCFDDELL